MEFEWPNYDRETLDDGRAFSATFVSWDQRKDQIYYRVTLHEDGRDFPPFTIRFGTAIPESEWGRPDFAARLREDFVHYAREGKTNVPDPVFRF